MATKKSGNAFAAKAQAAAQEKTDMEALVEDTPKPQKQTRKSQAKKGSEQPMQENRSEAKTQFSGELVTANFKIPSDARKKLKRYALENDTTTVAALLDWIASLPDR